MSLAGFTRIASHVLPAITGVHSNLKMLFRYDYFTPAALAQLDEGGGNLRFSSDEAGLNQLPCTVVHFDKASQNIEVYVIVPSGATGEVVYVWGGNSGATQPDVDQPFGRNATHPNHTFTTYCDNTSLIDYSGNVLSGVVPNNVTLVDGNIGGALDFNGSNSYVSLGTTVQPSGDFVQRVWFKSDALAGYRGIVGNWVGGANNRAYLGTLNAQLNYDSYTGGTATGGSLSIGQWYLGTAIREGTITKVYLNGTEVMSMSDTLEPNTAYDTVIGALEGGGAYHFDGSISLVEMMDVSISAEEELTVYQNQSAVGSWGVMTDEPTGGTVVDLGGDVSYTLEDTTTSLITIPVTTPQELILDSVVEESITISTIISSENEIASSLNEGVIIPMLGVGEYELIPNIVEGVSVDIFEATSYVLEDNTLADFGTEIPEAVVFGEGGSKFALQDLSSTAITIPANDTHTYYLEDLSSSHSKITQDFTSGYVLQDSTEFSLVYTHDGYALRVKGTIDAPVLGQVMDNVTILIQCIASSTVALSGSFSTIECNAQGDYDFYLREGTYRIYIKYSTSTPVNTLGECGVVDGMPEELDLNNLLTNYTPQVPDWIDELDRKWNETWDEFVNDNNTEHAGINNSVALGDAKVVEDMSVYVNDVTGQQGAALREEISAGDSAILNQSKAYTDTTGNELASDITQVSNSVSTVSQELTTFKSSTGDSFSQIDNRITANEASLSSTITAEVDAQTGEMQLRIADVIETNNAEIAQSIEVIENALGDVTAAWQVVATVDDLTSAIGMTNDGINSEIYMHANALRFVDPSDTSKSLTPIFEIEDGLVSMNNAYIRTLGTTTLTAGSITSPNYEEDTLGFSINSDGSVDLNNVKSRGTIEAVDGKIINRMTVGSGYIDGRNDGGEDFFNVNGGRARITHDGDFYASNGTFAGSIYANKMVGNLTSSEAKAFTETTFASIDTFVSIASWTVGASSSGLPRVILSPTMRLAIELFDGNISDGAFRVMCNGVQLYRSRNIAASASSPITEVEVPSCGFNLGTGGGTISVQVSVDTGGIRWRRYAQTVAAMLSVTGSEFQ